MRLFEHHDLSADVDSVAGAGGFKINLRTTASQKFGAVPRSDRI